MNDAMTMLFWNLGLSVPLALVAWCLCRLRAMRARPALCHGLWMLVLLKLVTPPLIPLPVLPALAGHAPDESSTSPPAMESRARIGGEIAIVGTNPVPSIVPVGPLAMGQAEPAEAAPELSARPRAIASPVQEVSWPSVLSGLAGFSLLVSLAIGVAAAAQYRMMTRLLRGGTLEAGRSTALLQQVAQRFHVRCPPRLVVVKAAVTPMLWAAPGRPTIVLPLQLVDALGDDELRSVLAHEMAHLVRRDHWFNSFAFAVGALFWWNPVAWIARREAAVAAEACCDALAIERSGGSRKAYAATLLAIVDFLAAGAPLRPALGVAFGRSGTLRRRMETLASDDVKSTVSRGGWMLLVIGVAATMLMPIRAAERPQGIGDSRLSAPEEIRQLALADEPQAPRIDPNRAEPVAKTDQPAAGKYFVEGRVFDEQTREPIAGAELQFLVAAEIDPEKRQRLVSTDEQGRFRCEVPIGVVRLWNPQLKPGYWLEPDLAMKTLATSVEKPVATLEIPAKRGPAWPVRVIIDGGLAENPPRIVALYEVEDDEMRAKVLKGEPVSFQKQMNLTMVRLDPVGRGAFTQCGPSGKLWISVGSWGSPLVKGINTEAVIDPAFDNTKVRSATPIAGSDRVELVDEGGKRAIFRNAEVTLSEGRPLVTYRLQVNTAGTQEFAGRIVDAQGAALADVRIGSAVGTRGGSSEWIGVANTDAEGWFLLRIPLVESPEEQQLTLVITKDGYAAFDSPSISVPRRAGAAIDTGRFVMQKGRSLPIRIIDERGRPVAGAVVEPGSEYALRRMVIRTDAEGRGTLRNLPVGVLSVLVSHADRNESLHIVVSADDAANKETTLRAKAPPATPAPANAAPATERPAPIAVGKIAPEFDIDRWTDGGKRKLADYRGKVVVLDFWGVWCSSCIYSIPTMQSLADKYETKGVVFLGIHTPDGDLEQIDRLKKTKGWSHTSGIDRGQEINDGATALRYGVNGFPTVVVVDVAGKIAFNSGLQDDPAQFMKEMQDIAAELKIPFPSPDKEPDDQAIANLGRLMEVMFAREIEKALTAGKK